MGLSDKEKEELAFNKRFLISAFRGSTDIEQCFNRNDFIIFYEALSVWFCPNKMLINYFLHGLLGSESHEIVLMVNTDTGLDCFIIQQYLMIKIFSFSLQTTFGVIFWGYIIRHFYPCFPPFIWYSFWETQIYIFYYSKICSKSGKCSLISDFYFVLQ